MLTFVDLIWISLYFSAITFKDAKTDKRNTIMKKNEEKTVVFL
ncbi:hypothetical protein [Mesomycoplasma hyorhinis]|nr:hypothetical protein [Mesomycoplasma hyorhinis]